MSIIKGIKVGSTDIISTYTEFTEKSDTKQIEVIAVELDYIYTPDGSTYTGFEQTPTPRVTAYVDGVDTTLIKDVDYILSYSNNKSAGVATVTATGINNFTGSLSANWTINPADISVEYEDQSYLYNGNNQGVGIRVSTVYDNPIIKYGISRGVYNLDSPPQIRNVSDSKTIYYKVTASNHNPVEGSYTININPKSASILWGESSWIYDGNSHSTTCVVSNLISGDVCDVILSNNSITNIGSIDVYASSLSNTNYVLPNDGLRYTITIRPGMFYKSDDNWIPVKSVYKKISGIWVKQEFSTVFNTGEMYMKK